VSDIVEVMARAMNDGADDQWLEPFRSQARTTLAALDAAGYAVVPKVASEGENRLLAEGRALIAAYEEAATMIQTGLYAKGSDASVDRAVALWPALDAFVGARSDSVDGAYARLAAILGKAPPE